MLTQNVPSVLSRRKQKEEAWEKRLCNMTELFSIFQLLESDSLASYLREEDYFLCWCSVFFIIIIFSSFPPYLRTHVFNLSWKYVFDSRRPRPRQMSLERLAKLFLCLPAGLLAAAEIIFINLSRWASPPRDKKRPRPCMKQCFGHFVCVSKISLLMAPQLAVVCL